MEKITAAIRTLASLGLLAGRGSTSSSQANLINPMDLLSSGDESHKRRGLKAGLRHEPGSAATS